MHLPFGFVSCPPSTFPNRPPSTSHVRPCIINIPLIHYQVPPPVETETSKNLISCIEIGNKISNSIVYLPFDFVSQPPSTSHAPPPSTSPDTPRTINDPRSSTINFPCQSREMGKYLINCVEIGSKISRTITHLPFVFVFASATINFPASASAISIPRSALATINFPTSASAISNRRNSSSC